MFERRLPTSLRDRESSLTPWQGLDPVAVERMFALLAEASFWKADDARRLRPDDRLWKIYGAYYPNTSRFFTLRPCGDHCEMETILAELRRENPATELPLHVTLGELVRMLSRTTSHGTVQLVLFVERHNLLNGS